MTPRTLPREPWRGGQICGHQIHVGGPGQRADFCGELKGIGLPTCEEHWDELIDSGESMVFAPGNALGGEQWHPRLLWEPYDDDVPVEPSYEEMARYATI